MRFYFEITLLPCAEIGYHFLWSKLYQQIHLGLAEIQASRGIQAVGVSFPDYSLENEQNRLGLKLRLFSESQHILEEFDAKKWLCHLVDYIHITSIRNIPSNIKGYVRFKRQQPKSNIERLARRKAKYEDINLDQALHMLKGREEVFSALPFIKIRSLSSRQHFPVFITKENALHQINEGFSCYGLSTKSTLPEF